MLEKSSQIATILALLITIVSIFLGLNFTNFTNFHTFSEDKNLKTIFVLLGDNSNKLNGDLSFNLYNISGHRVKLDFKKPSSKGNSWYDQGEVLKIYSTDGFYNLIIGKVGKEFIEYDLIFIGQ